MFSHHNSFPSSYTSAISDGVSDHKKVVLPIDFHFNLKRFKNVITFSNFEKEEDKGSLCFLKRFLDDLKFFRKEVNSSSLSMH